MRTTIDINDALLRELRERAHTSRRPFRSVVEEALQRGLSTAPRGERRTRARIQSRPIGIKAGLQAMSMNQLYDQIEAEQDGGRFRALRWTLPLEPRRERRRG